MPTGVVRRTSRTTPTRTRSPAWSPDGSKIAYGSSTGASASEIYAMNADGSGQTNLTNDPADDSSPAWSPDGSQIAFSRFDDNVAADVYVMNADGSDQTDLTSVDPG